MLIEEQKQVLKYSRKYGCSYVKYVRKYNKCMKVCIKKVCINIIIDSIYRTYHLAKKLEHLKNAGMCKYMSVPILLHSRRTLPDSAVGLFLKFIYSIRNKAIYNQQ